MRATLAALLSLGCLLSTPAQACDYQDRIGAVLGVAADGRFIYYSETYYDDVVGVYQADGKRVRECHRNNDDEEQGWKCRGDKAFRPRHPRAGARAVAEAWAQQLGGVTVLQVTDEALAGIKDVFCSRIVFWTGAGAMGCKNGREFHVLDHPSSSVVFFRYRIGFDFCGSHNKEENDQWLGRDELDRRLRARAATFLRRRDSRRAIQAFAALRWLHPDDGQVADELRRLQGTK